MNNNVLTDDQAALIWSGETSSLLNMNPEGENATPDTPKPEEVSTPEEDSDDNDSTTINEDEITSAFAEEDDDDDESDEGNPSEETNTPKPEKKAGRKPVELVSMINQLVDEEILHGFEDSEVKTIDEAKELIKLNLESREKVAEDNWWTNKVQNYSPQIQAILHYAEKGGGDVTPLIQAMSQVEQVYDLDVETEQGQEEIVRQTLKSKGFDEEEIEDQISTLKDLDKLKTKAEKFFPELDGMKKREVQRMLQEQERRQEEARKATDSYVNTIKTTLEKETIGGVKLKREEKAKIFSSLVEPKYTSLNGSPTNGFVKALEDLQFGNSADYEHFLNIVLYAIDKESFLEKIKATTKQEVTAETVKKLKTSRNPTPNVEEVIDTRPSTKKPTISKGFRNPFQ